jgi:predicted transcriptional regulator
VSEPQNTPNYIELAADIVSAFVSNNSVPATELPALIGSVHAALNQGCEWLNPAACGGSESASSADQEVGPAGLHCVPG